MQKLFFIDLIKININILKQMVHPVRTEYAGPPPARVLLWYRACPIRDRPAPVQKSKI